MGVAYNCFRGDVRKCHCREQNFVSLQQAKEDGPNYLMSSAFFAGCPFAQNALTHGCWKKSKVSQFFECEKIFGWGGEGWLTWLNDQWKSNRVNDLISWWEKTDSNPRLHQTWQRSHSEPWCRNSKLWGSKIAFSFNTLCLKTITCLRKVIVLSRATLPVKALLRRSTTRRRIALRWIHAQRNMCPGVWHSRHKNKQLHFYRTAEQNSKRLHVPFVKADSVHFGGLCCYRLSFVAAAQLKSNLVSIHQQWLIPLVEMQMITKQLVQLCVSINKSDCGPRGQVLQFSQESIGDSRPHNSSNGHLWNMALPDQSAAAASVKV